LKASKLVEEHLEAFRLFQKPLEASKLFQEHLKVYRHCFTSFWSLFRIL